MKKVFLSACLLAALPALAQQELAYKIPQQAGAVVTIRGNKLLELLSASEYNNTEIGKKMIKEMSRKSDQRKVSGIDDLGIDLTGSVYYYNVQTDSISYNGLLLPLSDAAKFERLLDRDEKITREGDTRTALSNSDKMTLTWNDKMASLVFSDLKGSFFNDSAAAARYGIKEEEYTDSYSANYDVAADTIVASVDTAYAVDVAPAEVVTDVAEAVSPVPDKAEEPAIAVESAEEEPATMVAPALEEIPADAPDPPMVVVDVAPVEAATPLSFEQQRRRAISDDNWAIRQKLRKTWTETFAHSVFARQLSDPSVLSNPEFIIAQDKNASATLYLKDVSALYSDIFSYFSYRHFARSVNGFKGLNAQLYLNKENMRITSELVVDDKKAASYKKLYGHKLNSKFAKYVNSDKLIGFVSYSLDAEEYLKELPTMLSYAWGGYLDKYTEELDIASELLSVMLDEKAMAKVVKGDALLMITDIAQKERTYKTYEYNDDWDKKEITRTKKETLPEFMLMFSSDDSRIITRMLNYGVHKGGIKEKAGIYTLDPDISKSPMSVHLLIKDGIVFVGTSYKDIENISLDRFQGNISKEHKKLLMKNNVTTFFDPKKLVGKMSMEEFRNSRRLAQFNNWMSSMGKFYGRTTGIKGNKISGELIAEVPQGQENALKYFFSLIDGVSKLD